MTQFIMYSLKHRHVAVSLENHRKYDAVYYIVNYHTFLTSLVAAR